MMDEADIVLRAARTLERLQKEAQKRVLSAYRFEKNTVRGSVIRMQHEHIADRSVVVVLFELNGNEMERRFEVDLIGKVPFGARQAFEYLVKAIEREVLDVFREQAFASFASDIADAPPFKGAS